MIGSFSSRVWLTCFQFSKGSQKSPNSSEITIYRSGNSTKCHLLSVKGGRDLRVVQGCSSWNTLINSQATAAYDAAMMGTDPLNNISAAGTQNLEDPHINSSVPSLELDSSSRVGANLDLVEEEWKPSLSGFSGGELARVPPGGHESLPAEEDLTRSSGAPRFSPANLRSPFSPRSCRVAVIGAGAAGLVAARELVREGHKVVMYEQGDEVGGVWLYDPRVESDPLGVDPNRTRVHGSMYPSLRTNLPREIMGYLDYPFLPKPLEGRDNRRFPSHEEVALYLKDFAEAYNLLELVKFNVKVEYVGPEFKEGADMQWVVKFRNSAGSKAKGSEEIGDSKQGEQKIEIFDAVVVCNGHYAESRIVHIPGIQVVVVIGSANSAEDITREVAQLAKEVHQCARAWTSTELSTENIWKHPMVERVCADGMLKFRDGTSTVADVIIHCTGYLYSFPFLDTRGYVSVEDNRVGPLYKHIFPPALSPTLSFVGLPWKVVPFPLMELQSRWIARLLSGKASLPSVVEMIADVRAAYEWMETEQQPKSYTHNCGAYQYEYVDWLAEQSGNQPVETWRKQIYLTTSQNKRENAYSYRDEWQDQHLLEVSMNCLKKIKSP